MSDRAIRLHAFFSVKGGVGKSTLATVCAKIQAAKGRVPVLIDCDLTGTSIADGLRLRAPKVALHPDGSIDLEAAPTGEPCYSVVESWRLRAARRARLQTDEKPQDQPQPPPYLNDALNHVFVTETPARVDALLWLQEREDGVLYLPSSSAHGDVVQSIEWLYGEPFDWARSLVLTLDHLAQQMPALTDVVLDLPPGIWGLSHETLVLMSVLFHGTPLPADYPPWHAGPVRWLPNPFMVMTRDPNDFVPALEYVARHTFKIPTLKPIVNRVNEGLAELRGVARERLGPILGAAGLEEKLDKVDLIDALAKLFWDGDIASDSVPRAVMKTLRLEEKA
jgi:hypothetical protein